MNKRNFLRVLFFFIPFFIYCLPFYGQELEFSGVISDSTSASALPGAAVVLRAGEKILGFDFSDGTGSYLIQIEKNNLQEVELEVSSMGARKQEKLIRLQGQNVFKTNFVLEDEVQSLSTVVISPDEKIEIKKDTIIYKVSRFNNGSERTVEDVLRNIPGIEIDQSGNIKAQGKNIEKILIEGDDLANSNYKIISQNLDAYVLDKVEVISNYEENPVLKQFLSSNSVVLNLKLKDGAKSILFGTIDTGAGVERRYHGDLNLGLIRPEVKFLNLGNLNNTGQTAGDQLTNYVYGRQDFNDFSKDFEIDNEPLVDLNGSSILLDDRFYVANKSLADHLLLNKTLKEKVKLQASLNFYKENLSKEYLGTYDYFKEPERILFTEQNQYDFDNLNLSNYIEVSFPISDNNYVNFKNSVRVLNENTYNKLIFNSKQPIDQYLKDQNIDLETNLKYSRKIRNGAALFHVYLGSKNLRQELVISPNTFKPENDVKGGGLKSTNNTEFNYQGFETNLIYKKNRFSYSFTGGVFHLKEVLDIHALKIKGENNVPIDSLSGKNKATAFQTNLKLKGNYEIAQDINFNVNLNGIYIDYYHERNSNFFFLNPDLNLSIRRTGFGSFRFGYSSKSEIPRLSFLANNYILHDYRTLEAGAFQTEPITREQFLFSYTFSRPKKRILLNASLSYQKHENQLVKTNFIAEDLNISRFGYGSGQNFFSVLSGITTYIDEVNSSMKLGFSHLKFEKPSIINNEEVALRNNTSSVYFSGTTYFKGSYNLRFLANYSLSTGRIQESEVTNDRYNFKIENIVKIGPEFTGVFDTELFLIDSNLYNTSTAEIEYRPEDSEWVYGLRLQNLFNTDEYVFTNVNDFQETELAFRSVPRYFLFYAKLRF